MVAIFGDSRINQLTESELRRQDTSGYHINVYPMPGARFESVCIAAHNYIRCNAGDITYITAGVNDMTNPHRPTYKGGRRTFTFDWSTEDEFVFSLCDTVTKMCQHLLYLHNDQRIILCPIIGMQLNRTCTNATEARQLIMDNGIWRINSCIHKLNIHGRTSAPWISRLVHTNRNTVGRRHAYRRFLEDGLHYTETLTTLVTLVLATHINHIKDKIASQGYKPQ